MKQYQGSPSQMDSQKRIQNGCQHKILIAGLGFCILFTLSLACLFSYGMFYVKQELKQGQQVSHDLREEIKVLQESNEELKHDVAVLKQVTDDLEKRLISGLIFDDRELFQSRERREILSSGVVDFKSLIRGPPGPPGKDGRDGRDGKDGRDFTSLGVLRGVINETVNKEWREFSNQLPTYSGATYQRWGRKSCPPHSQLIYSGTMAGPFRGSAGGGGNYQCLPNDPEYDPKAPSGVPFSKLRSTAYEISFSPAMLGSGMPNHHLAPCTVCEAGQRSTQLMIPAKIRCPSDDWKLEYKGFLMSTAEQYSEGSYPAVEHFKSSYVCVDEEAESVASNPTSSGSGSYIYPVTVSCSGDGALSNCPPYLSDGRALSCVVCSK